MSTQKLTPEEISKVLKEVNLKTMKDCFFKAILCGYASFIDGNKLPDGVREVRSEYSLVNEKKETVFFDKYVVIDNWITTPLSEFSAGITTIYYDQIPIWRMDYSGYYKKDAIKFLKEALAKNYNEGVFLGGRGPRIFKNQNLIYRNNPRIPDFENFEGIERIVNEETGEEMGCHKYFGVSLLPQNKI